MNNIKFNLLLLFVFSLFSVSTVNVYAKTFSHVSIDEPLQDLLDGYSAHSGIPVIISDKVDVNKYRVNAKIQSRTPEKFIKFLETSYSLSCYFDGNAIYVHNKSEVETSLIKVSSRSKFDSIINSLVTLDLFEPKYNILYDENTQLMKLSAPSSYKNVILDVMKNAKAYNPNGVKAKKRAKAESRNLYSGELELRVFELKHAWAADRTILHRGKYVELPGVASTLKTIVGLNKSSKSKKVKKPSVSTPNNNLGDASRSLEAVDSHFGVSDDSGAAGDDDASSPSKLVEHIRIEANSLSNSILIMDYAHRMSFYENIIQKLDKDTPQIEIEVAILEIRVDKLQELGFDWNLNGTEGGLNLNTTSSLSSNATLSASRGHSTDANFSTIFTGDVTNVLGRMQALSGSQDAKVVSRPNVVTVDNQQAVIDNSSSIYVRVSGSNQDANGSLFQIDFGTTLKVLPRLSANQTGKRFMSLDVFIEDGTISEQTVDGIPVVSRNFINTQARVPEFSSLMIGGYYYQKTEIGENKVPILGDIPVVGNLFKSKGETNENYVKLFIISPNVITVDDYRDSDRRLESINDHLKEKNPDNSDLYFGNGVEIYD